MYLHGGNTKNIPKKKIIGIFDMDSATVSSVTKKYLKGMEKSGRMEIISQDLPKSFILTEDKVYLSSLAPLTLVQRCRGNTEKEEN